VLNDLAKLVFLRVKVFSEITENTMLERLRYDRANCDASKVVSSDMSYHISALFFVLLINKQQNSCIKQVVISLLYACSSKLID